MSLVAICSSFYHTLSFLKTCLHIIETFLWSSLAFRISPKLMISLQLYMILYDKDRKQHQLPTELHSELWKETLVPLMHMQLLIPIELLKIHVNNTKIQKCLNLDPFVPNWTIYPKWQSLEENSTIFISMLRSFFVVLFQDYSFLLAYRHA